MVEAAARALAERIKNAVIRPAIVGGRLVGEPFALTEHDLASIALAAALSVCEVRGNREEWATQVGWTGIALDGRTGHYWGRRVGADLPACRNCGRWMTDWSLINDCGVTTPTTVEATQ
jgi:hypothetical protein